MSASASSFVRAGVAALMVVVGAAVTATSASAQSGRTASAAATVSVTVIPPSSEASVVSLAAPRALEEAGELVEVAVPVTVGAETDYRLVVHVGGENGSVQVLGSAGWSARSGSVVVAEGAATGGLDTVEVRYRVPRGTLLVPVRYEVVRRGLSTATVTAP